MKRSINIIRNINEIEEALNQAAAGVFSIQLDNDKLFQAGSNFVYLDKNIYFFLDKNEEEFEHIKYGNGASFTILSSTKVIAKNKSTSYKLNYITVNGEIKELDDIKLADQVTDAYRQKYSPAIDKKNYEVSENLIPLLLDSNEIKAIVEEGN